MTATTLLVSRAGLHTTLQDDGRWGWQDVGVPVGGALDRDASRRANVLVGNEPDEAALEITLTGCALRPDRDVHVAITGARFDTTVDGAPVPQDCALELQAGATLDLGRRLAGARAYVAVRGGFDIAPVLGSRTAWPFTDRRGAIPDGARRARPKTKRSSRCSRAPTPCCRPRVGWPFRSTGRPYRCRIPIVRPPAR